MPLICVPDAATAAALNDLAVEVVVWDGTLPSAPAESVREQIEFLVPTYALNAWDAPTLAALPKLQVIQVLTAGVERWLDRVPTGVTLCTGRGIHGASTAELAFAAILSHLHRLPQFAAAQARHEWADDFTAGLRGRRVLVLGAGDIGSRVAAAARVFDAEVTLVARRARPGVVTLESLPQLLPRAQIVVVALPNTPATTGLINAEFLAALPAGALLVNVARGSLVATDALVAELCAGRLFAFLDVFETEPLPPEHPLWDLPNAVLSPHVGGGADGWETFAHRLIHDQLERYLGGAPLENVVSAGY